MIHQQVSTNKHPLNLQEIRRSGQDKSGGFDCNLGKIETGSNFQARSRKSKDGKDKGDGLAADQVNEQTTKMKMKMRTNTKTKMKIKIKMEKRERLTGWLLITQVNEQTPSVLQLNDDDD